MKKQYHPDNGMLNELKRGIARKDVYFCRTSAVGNAEYEAAFFGIAKIIQETGRNLAIYDFGFWTKNTGEYSSPDWYQNNSLTNRERGFGKQVSALNLDLLLRAEPFQHQNPHYDVIVIDRDLRFSGEDDDNFIFGYGPYPNNIISVKRFIHCFRDRTVRETSLAVLAAHEFAHNLSLVQRDYNIGRGEYKEGHCNGEEGPCLMEQVNIPDARGIDEQARLLFNRQNWLCPSCTKEIDTRKNYLREQGLSW